jgi:predicted Zn-dependent protease
MDRAAQLKEILAMDANNAFARYGLAMEYSNAGEVEPALSEFRTLIAAHPDYSAGYHMAAQLLARENRVPEARQWLQDGIAAAVRTGNSHARSEMEGLLEELS